MTYAIYMLGRAILFPQLKDRDERQTTLDLFDTKYGEWMGRVVTAISYAEDSEFAYMIKEMKRNDKNVSKTIVNIVERHMGLYDEVQRLNKRMDHLVKNRTDHESAAKWLNLELE